MPILSYLFNPCAGNIGTVHWSAPEVLNSARYQFPADVYSFGMVLYEMATGTVPFGAMLPVAVMMAVAIRRVKPPLVKPVNPMLAQLIYKSATVYTVSTVVSCDLHCTCVCNTYSCMCVHVVLKPHHHDLCVIHIHMYIYSSFEACGSIGEL